MKTYKIEKKVSKRKMTKKWEIKDPFIMKPKMKKHNEFISVNEIYILNPDLKAKAIQNQFQFAYKKAFKNVMKIIAGEDTESGGVSVSLNEIQKLKKILKEKYAQKVSIEEYHAMARKILFLENELKKYIHFQQRKNTIPFKGLPQNEEERGRSR